MFELCPTMFSTPCAPQQGRQEMTRTIEPPRAAASRCGPHPGSSQPRTTTKSPSTCPSSASARRHEQQCTDQGEPLAVFVTPMSAVLTAESFPAQPTRAATHIPAWPLGCDGAPRRSTSNRH
jgi:hypothetical protein